MTGIEPAFSAWEAELVAASGSTLTQLCGAGPIVAARILVAVGDPTRFPTKNKFGTGRNDTG